MKKQTFIFILIPILLYSYSLLGQTSEYDFPTMRWTPNYGLKNGSVNDIAVDSRGVIWICTLEGLYRNQADKRAMTICPVDI